MLTIILRKSRHWLSLMDLVLTSLGIFVPWWLKPHTVAKLGSNLFLLLEIFIKSPSYLLLPFIDFLKNAQPTRTAVKDDEREKEREDKPSTRASKGKLEESATWRILKQILVILWFFVATVFLFLVSTIPLLCACVPGFLFFNIFIPYEIVFLEKRTTTTFPYTLPSPTKSTPPPPPKIPAPTEFEHEGVGLVVYWCAADRVAFAISLLFRFLGVSCHRACDVVVHHRSPKQQQQPQQAQPQKQQQQQPQKKKTTPTTKKENSSNH